MAAAIDSDHGVTVVSSAIVAMDSEVVTGGDSVSMVVIDSVRLGSNMG